MKITRLTAENVKRLSAVTIEPNGSLTVIGGEHAAGKSSVLDSIMYVLAGGKTLPPQPLRRGEKRGKIVLELDGDESGLGLPMTVTRTFAESGTSSLEIKTSDGFKAPSPQSILDDLCGCVAFDPLSFTLLKPKQQAEAVRELLGLDFEEMDRKRAVLFDQRTIVNREAKSLGSQLEAAPKHEGVPEAEVSVSELAKELQRRQQINSDNYEERQKLARQQSEIDIQAKRCADLHSQITKLEAELAMSDDGLNAMKDWEATANESVSALVDLEVDEVHKQIETAEETNRKVRENYKHDELQNQFADKSEVALELTESIDQIDGEKLEQLTEAKWPVEGMNFSDDGLTYDDLPFEQINKAKQIEVSVAMGFAANPTLPVLLIREGSLMDVSYLPLVAKMAEDHGGQVWMERVGEGDECSVIIEDGMVKESTDG